MSTIPASGVDERQGDHDGADEAPRRHTVPLRTVEERGFGVLDDLLVDGPVRLSAEDGPGYVVLTEALFEEWLDDRHEAYVARVQAALADVAAGRVQRYETTEEIMEAIHNYRDEE